MVAVIALLFSGCDQEPDDPFDRYIWQFERKVQVLLDHLNEPDDIVETEGTVLSDRGLLKQKVKHYRYMLIPGAAEEVIQQFTSVPEPLLLAMREHPVDPPVVEQETAVGNLLIDGCGRGGIYSNSSGCRQGRYGYDEDGKLFFYVWHRQLQQLMLEQILDLDIKDWVHSVEAAGKRSHTGR